MKPVSLVLLAFAVACTPEPKADTGPEDTDDTTTTDTDDTSPRVVWEESRAETSQTLTDVYASGQGVYAVSTGGLIWTYRQASGWSDASLAIEGEDANGLWGTGSGDSLAWVAVADAGNIIHYGGAQENVDLGTANFEAVDGNSTTDLVAVGWGGVFQYDGSDWIYEALPANVQLNDVWTQVGLTVVVGEDGAILHRDPKEGWEVLDSPTTKAIYGVDGLAGDDLWAVGKDGVVLHFDGFTWSQHESPTSQSLWDVYVGAENAVYVVGNNGAAFRWNGTEWRDLPTGVDNNLYGVHGSGATDCWAVGNRGMALHYTGG